MDDLSLTLPETFRAPYLRRLSLHGIALPKKFPLLPSTIALSTLSLTHSGASCYLPPRHLVTRLYGHPHLEELIIGFTTPIPLPKNKGELLPPLIPPVTLPALRRLTFRGAGIYLDNLVAQINTPLLERLSLTLFFELTVTLVNLTEFIRRTERFGCPVARVIFNKDGPSIYADHYEQQGIGKLCLHVDCKPFYWQIESVTLVCSALGDVLSIVEELTLDLNEDVVPSEWENTLDKTLWHELLLPFVGVKKLHIGSLLALKVAQALGSEAGGMVLPELQELEVSLKFDLTRNAFSSFIETRELMGHPVHLLAPPTLHEDEKALPSVTSSGVRLVARSRPPTVDHSAPSGPSSPRALEHSPRSLREMMREVERRLEKERVKQGRLNQERSERERLTQLAIKQDRNGKKHVLWQRLRSMRTDLEHEFLVQASLLREYLEWVQWEGLEREGLKREGLKREGLKREGLKREGLKREGLKWEGLKREGLKLGHLEQEEHFEWWARTCLKQIRLERARKVADWVRAARPAAPAARRSVALTATKSTGQLPTTATRRQRPVAAVLGRSHSL
jgi:hypothetical protein